MLAIRVLTATLVLGGASSCGSGRPEAPAPAAAPAPPFQVVGESHKQRRPDPPPATSPFFDGLVVRLEAARGEILGVQVLLDHRGPVEVHLELDPAVATIELFEVRYQRVVEPSTDLCASSAGPGEWPDILVPARSPLTSSDAAFFDVVVSPGASPGRHAGSLTVGERTVPVELTIVPVTIAVAEEPVVWAWYSSKQLATTHGLDPGQLNAPALVDWERRYIDLFWRHGVVLSTDYAPDPAFYAARQGLYGKMKWHPVRLGDDQPKRPDSARIHLAALAGTDLQPVSFSIDEPQTLWQRARVRVMGLALRDVTLDGRRVFLQVFDRWSPLYEDVIQVIAGPRNIPAERAASPPGIHWWTYNGRYPEAGSYAIDSAGTNMRVLAWIVERYQIELWYLWEALYFSDRYNKKPGNDVLTNPLTFDQRGTHITHPDVCNGDGLLAYPGGWPSLRLKAMRRGLQDRRLIRALRACAPEEADALVRELVPRAQGESGEPGERPAWPLDEPSFEAQRRKVLAALARCGVR